MSIKLLRFDKFNNKHALLVAAFLFCAPATALAETSAMTTESQKPSGTLLDKLAIIAEKPTTELNADLFEKNFEIKFSPPKAFLPG